MSVLSHLLDPAPAVETAACRRAAAKDDRSSLACVCGISAAGLALGLIAALGPAGSDVAVATALITVLGTVSAIGLGIGLAAAPWR
ncbi:hypothetical protein [Inquilinus sp. Marseille-Q2685]|uniref:hypothetical protein n=1 Tax=Inquilinus sp. Marseille-Q2685 TaxID=2866581 RepID=UPI001CE40DDA|nr:hypothetical protein [Inquilinus sp. Marseille-Q2685]